jgi:outer membrane protein assembly factor BamB
MRVIKPLDNPVLLQLRQRLADAPVEDEQLVGQIRALDLLARKAFFTSQAHLRMGGHLLLGGVIVLLISLKLAARWRARPPAPPDEDISKEYWRSATRAKELIAFAGLILVIVSLLAAYLTPMGIPDVSPEEAGEQYWESVRQNWPSFRGPGGYGVAYYTNAPTDWDGESGRNIRWKVEVPRPGANSPVVWGNRLLLSGATKDVREIYCYDTDTGELVWKKQVANLPGTPETPPQVVKDTGYAAPTLAVQDDKAFAVFANGDLVCYDLEGNQQWGFNVGVPVNHYGHSSSLIVYENLLLVQYDQNSDAKLMAFNVETGEQVWVTPRKKISWSSPAYIHTPLGVQLILNSTEDVDAYNPRSGVLLWTEQCLSGEVAPSPAFGGATVFVANEYAIASAIRLDTSGDTMQTEVVWQWDESLPEVASPVATEKHCYIATSLGEIVCLDIETGAKVWGHEFDEGFYSSPILVGDRIYALDLEGTMQIFKAGPQFELIGSPKLAEPTHATPAYLDGRIYVRTEKHIVCIEEASE